MSLGSDQVVVHGRARGAWAAPRVRPIPGRRVSTTRRRRGSINPAALFLAVCCGTVSGTGDIPDGGGGLRLANAGGAVLSREEFAREFQASSRVLWFIAAAILGDRERAKDVVQDAAITAMGKLADFQPGTSFAFWMGQIVRFTALNESRKQGRRAGSPLEDYAAAAPAVGPAGPAITSDGRLSMDQTSFDDRTVAALNELEETARACLLMRTVLDLGYAEIARALDIPEGTAMSHVHRARQAMRRRLTVYGVASGGEGRGA